MARSIFDVVHAPLQSRILTSRREFDSLFAGFTTLKAISYVVSPDLLLQRFRAHGLVEAEVIVGENLAGVSLLDQYRQALAHKDREVTRNLADLVGQGKLKIFVPTRTIHSKLFLLTGHGRSRVIQGSANLTEAARQGTNQVNYVWYSDLDENDPWLAQILADYAAHLKDCSLFMGDLMELLRQREAGDREEVIDAWLKGTIRRDEDETESRQVLHDLAARSLQAAQEENDPIFAVSLPDAPRARRQVERILAPLTPVHSDHQVNLDARAYLHHIEQVHGVPIMQVDIREATIRLALGGQVTTRCESLPDPVLVDQALAHLESYVCTVELGHSLDLHFAKASIFEALLYFLSSPFAHEHMKSRRRTYALVDSRGPQVLYLFGRAQNGKSTFVRFALQLLTGRHMLPLPGAQFSKTRILNASSLGTVFPLVFDDLDVSHKGGAFEEVLKSYWEVWWREDCAAPQLILTSNAENLKEWAKSRVKRVDFDVHFAPSESQKAALSRILEVENPIFKWFAFLYIGHLRQGLAPAEDELHIARAAMKELYLYASRPVPEFFAERPLEQVYDPGRKVWRDLLFGLRKASIERRDGRLLVGFKDEMQYNEVRAAVGHLPQTVKYQIKGKTIVIESPGEFETWLRTGRASPSNWLGRFWEKVQGGV